MKAEMKIKKCQNCGRKTEHLIYADGSSKCTVCNHYFSVPKKKKAEDKKSPSTESTETEQ